MLISLSAATPPIPDFIEWVEAYQSNHYGNFDGEGFRKAYFRLPAELKAAIKYNKRGRLYRGDEFLRADLYDEYRKGRTFPALSFTPKATIAAHFGDVLPMSKFVDTYEGTIDTDNLVRYCNTHEIEHDIGDDEGEVILVGVKLK